MGTQMMAEGPPNFLMGNLEILSPAQIINYLFYRQAEPFQQDHDCIRRQFYNRRSKGTQRDFLFDHGKPQGMNMQLVELAILC
jgi:hypothetical protein